MWKIELIKKEIEYCLYEWPERYSIKYGVKIPPEDINKINKILSPWLKNKTDSSQLEMTSRKYAYGDTGSTVIIN